MRPGTEWFLDTAYAVALASRSDAWHEAARALSEEVRRKGVRLVTSHAVLTEIGNAMSSTARRPFAVRLLERLHRDPLVQIVPITADVFTEAFALYGARLDKEWTLTDCTSFVIMQRLGIGDALTADRHFEQAGFTALMRSR